MIRNKKGMLGALEIAMIVVVVGILGFVGWRIAANDKATSNDDTVKTNENDEADFNETVGTESEVQVEFVGQELEEWQKEDCEVILYPKDLDAFVTDEGLSVTPITVNTAFLTCNDEVDERHHILVEGGLQLYIDFTDKEFFEFYSGAPADVNWSTDLVLTVTGYSLDIKGKDDANLVGCDTFLVQNCGEDFEMNITVDHPYIRTIVITLIDEGYEDAPRYTLYEDIISTILLPLDF